MNIVDPILFQCARQPGAPALCAPGTGIGLISYGRLAQHIHNISRRLLKLGLQPGTIAAVHIADPIFSAAVTLALTRIGVVTISRFDDRIVDAVKIDAVIADTYPQGMKIEQVILADLSWTRGDGSPLASHEIRATSGEEICRIALTSGSTGIPKAVAFSHSMIADRMAPHMMVWGSRVASTSRTYCDLPVTTALGFRFMIYALWRGGMFMFPGETFTASADAMDEFKIQCWLTSPKGLEILLKGFEQYPLLQSEVAAIAVPGDLLPRSLADRARARICPTVISAYGATETTMTATAPVHLLGDAPGEVGFLTPDVRVEIVDGAGAPQTRGTQGVVRVKSRYMIQGYVGDPKSSAVAFRDGWFYPGDIGVLEESNLLRIIGRQDAVLNLGGDKISPELIEQTLSTYPGLIECAAFALPGDLGLDGLWVAYAAEPTVNDAQLQQHCVGALPNQLRPAGFIRVDKLPRNEFGKIDRLRLPQLGPAARRS